jgi:hypothetical protein
MEKGETQLEWWQNLEFDRDRAVIVCEKSAAAGVSMCLRR